MKNVFKVVLAVSALFLMGNVNSYAQKFGYIHFEELIFSMPEMDGVRTNFEAFQKDLEDQYESMTVELNNKYNDFVKNQETMSDAIREIRAEEMQSLTERRNQFSETAGQLMQQEQSKLMAPLFEKASEALQKVSKENGFTAVFELGSQALMYYDESTFIDVLPLVKAELGIN